MRIWRPHNLYYRKAQTDNDTWKKELPEKGKCTRLVVQVENPNTGQHWGTLGGVGAHIYHSRVADRITKLEVVVDGNHPIKSLTGLEAQILSFYRDKKVPPDYISDPALSSQRSFFIFDFGRYFGDPDYYLDWEKHASSELRITNDFDGTVYASGVITVDEFISHGDPLPASKGVFTDRQLKEYTTVQNGEEPTKIPTTDPIRSLALMVRPTASAAAGYHWKSWPWECVETIDLSFLEEKLKLLDTIYARQLMRQNTMRFGYARTGGKAYLGGRGDSFLTGIGFRHGTVVSFADVTGTALLTRTVAAWTWMDNPLVVNPDSAGNDYFDFSCWGQSYHDSFMLFDAIKPVEENLITKDEAPVRLKLKTQNDADAADATVDIIMSVLETYGAGLGSK